MYDVLEGRPVCLGGVALVGLAYEEANELVDMLNRQTWRSNVPPGS